MAAADSQHCSGEGTPLVLVHGITSSWRAWQPVIPLLAAEHTVFAPSLAGHNLAAAPERVTLSVLGLTDALESQMDAAGIGTAHVAGNSLGGWIALELARRGRARSVVALSPAGGWREPGDLLRVLRLVRLGRVFARHPLLAVMLTRPRVRQAILRGVSERGHLMTSADARLFFDDILKCSALSSLLQSIERDGPLPPLLRPSCPVRIAWAQHDRTIPFGRYGAPLAEAVPGAEVLSLVGVGHVPMHDDPAPVTDTILGLTKRVDHAAERGRGQHSPRRAFMPAPHTLAVAMQSPTPEGPAADDGRVQLVAADPR
jgi:pimeloyl-ACP methyl ester carboxylesterase